MFTSTPSSSHPHSSGGRAVTVPMAQARPRGPKLNPFPEAMHQEVGEGLFFSPGLPASKAHALFPLGRLRWLPRGKEGPVDGLLVRLSPSLCVS